MIMRTGRNERKNASEELALYTIHDGLSRTSEPVVAFVRLGARWHLVVLLRCAIFRGAFGNSEAKRSEWYQEYLQHAHQTP